MKRTLLCLMAFLQTIPALGAVRYGLNTAQGVVRFNATGSPGAFSINGTTEVGENVVTGEGVEEAGRLSLRSQFSLERLDTGIGLRTRHMKEKYLEVEKFPLATLTVDNLPLGEGSLPFTGNLELHGVTKPVTGTLQVLGRGEALSLKAEFTVRLGDFAIEVPRFAGVSVDERIPIVVEVSRAKAL